MVCALAVLQWREAGATDHAQALLRESHLRSWFSIDGHAGISACTTGTLAGTSLADLVFILAIGRVAKSFEAELMALGLVTELPSAGAALAFGLDDDAVPLTAKVMPPAWVDDLAIPTFGEAKDVLGKGAADLACAWNTFRRVKMTLNMGLERQRC